MKTLGEIIDEVKSGGRTDYEDLRYALVALDALRHFDQRALMKLAKAKKENLPALLSNDAEWAAEESFRRTKTAFEIPPKQYVGESNDPDNPECQRFRKVAIKLWNRVVEQHARASHD